MKGREQRIRAGYDALLVFAGYMQSQEAKNAKKRYRLWRRSHKEVRVWIATACQNKSMSSRVALILLNDTMELK